VKQLSDMQKILVPTDFSPNAERAIDYAVQIAKAGKATVVIIHACEQLDNVPLSAGFPITDYNKRITDEAFENLELIQKSIQDTEGIKAETELLAGTVADTVAVAVSDFGADLVVMGTMGITGLRDALFGTNTSTVIGHSAVPVLAIPLEYEWSTPSKFVLAINNFEEVTDIINPVFELAAVFRATVQIIVFTDEDEASASEFMADEQAVLMAEEKLKQKYPSLAIKATHLSGRHFEETIIAYVDKNKVDVLAMTTHKRSLIGSIFNRSITRKMSYHSKVPVLAIPVK
jgi:nucleotide-binding universal stress UspA family protein